VTESAIACRGLSRRFGQLVAVESLDLAVPAGHCYALLGPNGAGKTTTVRMLCALITPTGGSATVAGCELGKQDDVLHERIGLLTEVPGLYERLSARENLEFFARAHGLSRQHARTRIDVLLRDFELAPRAHESVAKFSKGMKQKLAVARALLHEPHVLFLDEPTSGLDPEAAYALRERIVSLKREGRTILLTTHRLEEAAQLADSVAIFSKGRVVTSGTVKELRRRVGRCKLTLRLVRVVDLYRERIAAISGVESVELDAERGELNMTLADPDRQTPSIVAELVAAGAEILEVKPEEASLEEAYLALIKGGAS
jgi:ABC-2 type transport system ATP-binding protein